jgi:M6 family metalloprotease-like protein
MPYPFYGKEFEFIQPDGSAIKVKGWGNQYHAVFESIDGFTVVKNPETGFYEYAKPSMDNRGVKAMGHRIGTVDPKALGIEKHIRASTSMGSKSYSPLYQERSGSRWQERRRRAQLSLSRAARGALAYAPPKEERIGDYTGLCILIQFPDESGTIPSSEVDNFCNKEGYTGFNNHGSVYDYFYEESLGKLRYKNITIPYYTAKHERSYYTDPSIEQPMRAIELIQEALTDLKDNNFDFEKLSVDDEGYIYALNAFYAGPCVNDWAKGLWPHSCWMEPAFEVGNGIRFKDYQITNMGRELTLGTFCHENGHMIGDFPDLYDYGTDDPKEEPESVGVGNFCLMGYGGPDEKNPVQIGAYLKYKAGWAGAATHLIDGIYTAKANENDFFIWPKDHPLTEYFLVENRLKEGRDVALPCSGLAIWHIDELGNHDFEDMLPCRHYECSLEQADGRFDLEHMRNLGDKTDLFSSMVKSTFGSSTEPNSNWWNGTPSGLEVVEIGNPGREVSFRIIRAG